MTGPGAPEWPKREWAPRWHAVLLEQTDGIPTPTAAALRAVLALHVPTLTYPKQNADDRHCPGDDFSGYDGEPPDWPCQTITAVVVAFGLRMTARCPTCTPNAAHDPHSPVWPDGRLVTHRAYRLGGITCPSSLTVGLTAGQLGP